MYRAADCCLHTQLTANTLSLQLMGQEQPGREGAWVQKQKKCTSELEFGGAEGGMQLGAFPRNHLGLMSEWKLGCSVAHLECVLLSSVWGWKLPNSTLSYK